MNFTVMQFGFSTFKWNETENVYKATAFNFYLHKDESIDFPSVFAVQVRIFIPLSYHNNFHFKNQCYKFLSENHMDFNRVFSKGIVKAF